MSPIRFEIPEKFRFKKLKNTLLQKREFIDFAIWKLAGSTHDDGKELIGWSASDYFGMQDSIDVATRKSKSSFTTKDYCFGNEFSFDLNSLSQLSFDEDCSVGSSIFNTPDFINECDVYTFNPPLGVWKTPKFTKSLDFYESIWDALMCDEAFVAEIIHTINKKYKTIRRIYFVLFHSHPHQVSITSDLSKYYEYFDLITTLKEGSGFVQISTNSVKKAKISRKPFIKNGKSIKLKKYSLAA